MQDGEIRIKTKIDNSELEQGTEEIDKTLKKSADKNAALAKGTAGAVVAVAAKATKKILQGIREVSEAYKVQSKAERALATAAKNNPYLNNEAVKGLKRFASELQNVSNYGDEFTLQFMTRLAAAGRTQDQIQRIIKASADIAASGAMSFESAVNNLNKTFSGLAGELGESVPAIRNLTQEELKQGKAIDVLAAQYKGMAENMADVRIQMENAKGDLKEAIGELTAPAANAWDDFWLGFYNRGIELINTISAQLDQISGQFKFGEINKLVHTQYTNKITGETYGGERKLTDEQLSYWVDYFTNEYTKKVNGQLAYFGETERETLQYLNMEVERRKNLVKAQEQQADAAKKQADAQKEVNDRIADADEQATAIKTSSQGSLEQQLAYIRKKAELTGEEVDEQEIYNAILENYLDLIVNSNGLISENNELSKQRKKELDEQTQKLKDYNAEQAKADKLEEQRGKLRGLNKKDDLYSKYTEEQAELKAARDYWQNLEIVDANERADALAEIDKKILQNTADVSDQIASEVITYTEKLQGIVTGAADLMTKSNEAQTQIELANLDEKREKGTLTEEQYEKKKTEIKKKAAREQYKINMFEWTSSLLTATANIAQGVTKAFAAGWPMGIINGALLSAAGGIQLASIIGAKPVRPAFATGGIVPGNSYAGDNVEARVNSGEMILTQAQQKELFNMANGRQQSAAGPQIVINNNASNLVDASAQLDKNKIAIMIDAHVNEGLKSGKYNNSLAYAQQGQSGQFYGI